MTGGDECGEHFMDFRLGAAGEEQRATGVGALRQVGGPTGCHRCTACCVLTGTPRTSEGRADGSSAQEGAVAGVTLRGRNALRRPAALPFAACAARSLNWAARQTWRTRCRAAWASGCGPLPWTTASLSTSPRAHRQPVQGRTGQCTVPTPQQGRVPATCQPCKPVTTQQHPLCPLPPTRPAAWRATSS